MKLLSTKKLYILTMVVFQACFSSAQSFNCVRGQATPIIKKSEYPKAKFQLQSDSLTGIETLDMDNGDKLTINNWGCEYYTLTFRFETSRFHADTSDLHYWYGATGKLLTGMLSGMEGPIEIKKAIMYLGYRTSKPDLKLGEQIDFGGKEIRDFITLERIERISDSRCAVVVSVATGPL